MMCVDSTPCLSVDLDFFFPKFSKHLGFLRSLRSVSKRFNNLLEVMVFEVLKINPCYFPTRQTCEAITTELASGKSTVFSRATTRAELELDGPGAGTEEQLPWLEVVRLLTPTLIHLHSVRYVFASPMCAAEISECIRQVDLLALRRRKISESSIRQYKMHQVPSTPCRTRNW